MAKIYQTVPCEICGNPSKAKKLCDFHYQRWARNHSTEVNRPVDWGGRSSHPLYGAWCWTGRKESGGRCERWTNFWNFVADVGDKPSENHRFKRKNNKKPFSPENCFWQEQEMSTKDKNAYARNWRKTNPNKSRNNDLKRKGITIEQYDKLYTEQEGKCAICKKPEITAINGQVIRLSVDHCHTTNKIRGLLCKPCNQAVGLLKDDKGLLLSAINYLENHQASKFIEADLDIPPLIQESMLSIKAIEPEAPTPIHRKEITRELRFCDIDGCDRLHSGHGFCSRHLKQYRAGHDPHETAKKSCMVCGINIGLIYSPGRDFCSNSCKMKYHRSHGCYSKERMAAKPRCSHDGCSKDRLYANGLCRSHGRALFRQVNPPQNPLSQAFRSL